MNSISSRDSLNNVKRHEIISELVQSLENLLKIMFGKEYIREVIDQIYEFFIEKGIKIDDIGTHCEEYLKYIITKRLHITEDVEYIKNAKKVLSTYEDMYLLSRVIYEMLRKNFNTKIDLKFYLGKFYSKQNVLLANVGNKYHELIYQNNKHSDLLKFYTEGFEQVFNGDIYKELIFPIPRTNLECTALKTTLKKIEYENKVEKPKCVNKKIEHICNQFYFTTWPNALDELLNVIDRKDRNMELSAKNIETIKCKTTTNRLYKSTNRSNIKDKPVIIEAENELQKLMELESKYKSSSPIVKKIISGRIERGYIAKKAKELKQYSCMLCEAMNVKYEGFKKKDGMLYIEAHHVIPVSTLEKGSLDFSNIITICPNHHRQLHFGNVEFTDRKNLFIFTIDGKEYYVPKIDIRSL